MESKRSSLNDKIKIAVKKKLLDDITAGKCALNLIQRDRNACRSICYVTTALHIYAHSISILRDTLKNFRTGRGNISLNKNEFLYSQTQIVKFDGTTLSEDELFELLEKFVKLIVSNMKVRHDIQNFLKTSSRFPYEELIGLCPKFSNGSSSDFEDPLEFFQFLCLATKPLQNKNDDPFALLSITLNVYYECTKCHISWEVQAENFQSLNLLTLLQKDDSKYITKLSDIIEANRAGIFIHNLLFPPEVAHNCDGNGCFGHIKRFAYFSPPQNGITMFYINRHIVENGFVGMIIEPDPDLYHGKTYMRHTSTTFFANSHHVIALTLDENRAIVHDDLQQESVAFESFSKFFSEFDNNKDQFNFGFYPDETYIIAYDTSPYDQKDATMLKCYTRHSKSYRSAKNRSETFIPQADYDLLEVRSLRRCTEQSNDETRGGGDAVDDETGEKNNDREITNDNFEKFYTRITSTSDPAAITGDGLQESVRASKTTPHVESTSDSEDEDGGKNSSDEESSSHSKENSGDKGDKRSENAQITPTRITETDRVDEDHDISLELALLDGPALNINNLKFVKLTKELLKRAQNYVKPGQGTIPLKWQKDKMYKKDYSDAKALVIYKGDKPSQKDFLGLWQIPSNSTVFPKHAMVHYGHAYLQKQPSFYENPYSMDIWNLPGIENEHRSILDSNLNLADLYAGDCIDMEDVCYTLEENHQFTQNLQNKPYIVDDSTIEEPFFMVSVFWKSKQLQISVGQKDFTSRGIIGFIRSSPVYSHQYCSYIARSYFEGKFPECYENGLIKLEQLKDDDMSSIASCILNDSQKPDCVPDALKNSLIDVVVAYAHSPVQTRVARTPLKDPAAQTAFDKLIQEDRLPLFYFVQKVDVNVYPKRVLKCQVPKRGSKQHKDIFMADMDHYSGFVMPSKIFTDKKIRGKVVPNGWIVSGLKPWYLTERLSENRKLPSEAFLFDTRKLLGNALSRPPSNELISERNQKNIKTIFSLFNLCQIAFNNISVDVLKEVLAHARTSIDKDEIEAMISNHKATLVQQTFPSKIEIVELITHMSQLPVPLQNGNLQADVSIDTDAALKIFEEGHVNVQAILNGVCDRALVETDHPKRNLKHIKVTEEAEARTKKRKKTVQNFRNKST